jgi:hypothetical protein
MRDVLARIAARGDVLLVPAGNGPAWRGAVAVPAGFTAAGRPHGVTLLAPAGSDAALARAAAQLGEALAG